MRSILPTSATFAAVAFACAGVATPALAQSDGDDDMPDSASAEGTVFDGDWVQVGVGAAYAPDYDGSNDYKVFPLPLIQGKLMGVDINPRPAGFALDFIPDGEDSKVKFGFGPAFRIRTSRTGDVEDPVVAATGKLDTAVEVGPTAGIGISGLLNPYDSLSANVDVRWDIAGAHDGMTIDPTLTYFTPVSRGAAVSLSFNAEYGDDKFNEYYYSVTPAQATASGLPQYDATSGFNKVGVNLLVGYDLDGNLANGGLALFAIGGYSRMLGEAKDSPYVALRGDANQFLVGAGVGYTF